MPTQPTPRERIGALAGLLVAAGVGFWAARSAAPPAPLPESAPLAEFSAERALRHVEAIAQTPRTPGTDAHRRALDYIIGELGSLGLEPTVQEGWVVRSSGSRAVGLYARNLVARLEGSSEGPALLLATHYDSVPTGPGAGDAAAGVAALLEAVRALREGPALRNDLILLVTDGEESGLLGARLFVDEHPWAKEVGLVLNFEARGNSGPVTLFETGPGNAPLVRAVADSAPYPMGSSLSYEVYRRMPNDTDLTVFLEDGRAGLNFAMIGNHPAYHTELDTPAALDRASLQHHGSYALALARRFGDEDLSVSSTDNAVYFNPLGSWITVYSVRSGKVLALALLFASIAVLLRAVIAGRMAWSGVRSGFWAWLVLVVTSAIALVAVWSLFERLFPASLASPYAEPYAFGPVLLGMALLVLAIALLLAALHERPSATELLAGTLLPWALLAWLVAMLVPGAGYLLVWPALAALAGLVLALLSPGGALASASLAAGALVAAALFSPTVVLVAQALGVGAASVVAVLVALPLSLALPALERVVGTRVWPAGLCALGGLAILGWVGLEAAPGADSPAPTSLFYLLDAQKAEAHWMSYESETDEWTRQVIREGTSPAPPPDYLPGRRGDELLQAPAGVVELTAPSGEAVEDRLEGDHRLMRVRVRSPRRAPFMMLVVDPSMATVRAIGVGGRLAELGEASGPVVLTLEGLPPEGAVVSIETLDRQPLKLDLLDWSWGLPADDGVELSPRPDSLVRRPRWLTDSLLVRTEQWY